MAKNKPGPKKKTYEESKHAVAVYVYGAKIKELGGLSKAKEKVLAFLNQ